MRRPVAGVRLAPSLACSTPAVFFADVAPRADAAIRCPVPWAASRRDGELEWFGWFFDQGFMSLDEEMRQMETFAKHIIPAFH